MAKLSADGEPINVGDVVYFDIREYYHRKTGRIWRAYKKDSGLEWISVRSLRDYVAKEAYPGGIVRSKSRAWVTVSVPDCDAVPLDTTDGRRPDEWFFRPECLYVKRNNLPSVFRPKSSKPAQSASPSKPAPKPTTHIPIPDLSTPLPTHKKYEFGASAKDPISGRTLHRVVALCNFGKVKKGDEGGWVENALNLSQEGRCWIHNNAKVIENAQITEDAQVGGEAVVRGKANVAGWAVIYDKAEILENAQIFGTATIFGNAQVTGDAQVYEDAKVGEEAELSGDALVHGNARIYGKAKVYDNAQVYEDAQVFEKAQVSEDAQVHGNARVNGKARISGNAEVYGNAKVEAGVTAKAKVYEDAAVLGAAEVFGDASIHGNATITDNAQARQYADIFGDAQVFGSADIYGKAVVYGKANIDGNAEIYESAKVYGNAHVTEDTKIHDNAQVYEDAQIYGNGEVSGNAEVYGKAQVLDYASASDGSKVCGGAAISNKAQVFGKAKVHNNAKVDGEAKVAGESEVYGDSEIHDNVEIAGNAKVHDHAKVSENAQVFGNAEVLNDAQVSGKAKVYDNSLISGDAQIYGTARVFDNAMVYGGAIVNDNAAVYGDAQVRGDAAVYSNAKVYDNAQVHGNVKVEANAKIYGDAELCGDGVFTGAFSTGVHCKSKITSGTSSPSKPAPPTIAPAPKPAVPIPIPTSSTPQPQKGYKYKLGASREDTASGVTLRQVVALCDFGNVKKGDKGGWVEHTHNLSQDDRCWIRDNAKVTGDAQVFGDAQVGGDAVVHDSAIIEERAVIQENAAIWDDAQVHGDATVFGDAQVHGDARIYGDADVSDHAEVYGDAWISERAGIYGDAKAYGDTAIYGESVVFDSAQVYGTAVVKDDAQICGNAEVYGDSQVFGKARISGDAKVYDNAMVHGSVQVESKAEISGYAELCGYGVFTKSLKSGVHCKNGVPKRLPSSAPAPTSASAPASPTAPATTGIAPVDMPFGVGDEVEIVKVSPAMDALATLSGDQLAVGDQGKVIKFEKHNDGTIKGATIVFANNASVVLWEDDIKNAVKKIKSGGAAMTIPTEIQANDDEPIIVIRKRPALPKNPKMPYIERIPGLYDILRRWYIFPNDELSKIFVSSILISDVRLLLKGIPGTGKTTLLEACISLFGNPLNLEKSKLYVRRGNKVVHTCYDTFRTIIEMPKVKAILDKKYNPKKLVFEDIALWEWDWLGNGVNEPVPLSAVARINPDKYPEEVLYYNAIGYVEQWREDLVAKELGKKAGKKRKNPPAEYENMKKIEYGFAARPRPIVTSRWKLFNEFNRANKAMVDGLMPLFSERSVEYNGRSMRSPKGVSFYDYNPHLDVSFGELDQAVLDRLDVSIYLPKAAYGGLRKIVNNMASFDQSVGELILNDLYTRKIMPLNDRELETVWRAVEKVYISSRVRDQIVILSSMFGTVWKKYSVEYYNKDMMEIPLTNTEKFIDTSVVSYGVAAIASQAGGAPTSGWIDFMNDIQRPAGPRTMISLIKISRAYAYLQACLNTPSSGIDSLAADKIEVHLEDVLVCLPYVLDHRINLGVGSKISRGWLSFYDFVKFYAIPTAIEPSMDAWNRWLDIKDQVEAVGVTTKEEAYKLFDKYATDEGLVLDGLKTDPIAARIRDMVAVGLP